LETISGCRRLKVNLKAKIDIYVNSTTKRCSNKITTKFLLEDFSHLSPVSTTPVVHSGAWGKLIHEKTRSRKSRGTVPLSCETLSKEKITYK
jgi:hypothetical protein